MSDYIPEETVFQILKSLPVKSLLRFRCVCKQWKQIIESSSFIQQHLSLQNQNPSPSFIHHDRCRYLFLSIDPCTIPPVVDTLNPPLDIENTDYVIIGTLHGVICLYHSKQFVLWNPSIREVSLLPLPERFIDCDSYLAGACCFSAFWIDPLTKDFKIVFDHIYCLLDEPRDGAFYSSAEQCWSLVSEETKGFNYRHYGQRLPAVMLEGVAYWVVMSLSYVHLVSFDFVKERYDVNETPLPDVLASDLCIPRICNWRESLSLLYCQDHMPCSRCEVYLMQQGLWVKIFGFNLSPDFSGVFWVWGNPEEERFRAVVNSGEDLALYDTKDGCLVLGSDIIFADDICYGFVESLLFPRLPVT